MSCAEDAVRPAARLPALLRRQQLLRLTPEGWARVLAAPCEDAARECLALWAAHGWPLVVTRQPAPAGAAIAVGLPAPARFGRRRIALSVAPGDVMFLDEFPRAEAVTRLLPREEVAAWRALVAKLASNGCRARVHGGFGWQSITRLPYVHADSDLDLLLPVGAAAHADEIVRLLAGATWNGPRLDGELLFPDGAAIAWREWRDHRQGRASRVLVKRLHGVALESPA
ncbi:MAG: malonate decarboxylase holo-[acyl-carrier-protein] synthase [Burkholderiaceae bacterium]|jgi:phosphoribosyl-dephospho-CoA transferase